MKKTNVGVALQGDPQTGITLIALIITIIVMLILVAVTINVALNGGLFGKAQTASDKTQREADREQLLSAVYGTLSSTGAFQIKTQLVNQIPDGWDAIQDTTNANYYKCTSSKGNVFYVNTETGAILDAIPNTNGGNSENEEDEGKAWIGKNFIAAGYNNGSVCDTGEAYYSLLVFSDETHGSLTIYYEPEDFETTDFTYTYNDSSNPITMVLTIDDETANCKLYLIKDGENNTINMVFVDEDYFEIALATNKGAGVTSTDLSGKSYENNNKAYNFGTQNGYGTYNYDSGKNEGTYILLENEGKVYLIDSGVHAMVGTLTKTDDSYTSFTITDSKSGDEIYELVNE